MLFKEDRAIYLQIADRVMDDILAQKWKEEDRIPSVRDLALSIEVNPNTVVHAYNYLQEKGVIYNKRGVGYFVSADAVANVRRTEREDFFQEQLPQIFKRMLLLKVDIQEVKSRFEEYRERNEDTHEDTNENE